jgi:hypothetical protein
MEQKVVGQEQVRKVKELGCDKEQGPALEGCSVEGAEDYLWLG